MNNFLEKTVFAIQGNEVQVYDLLIVFLILFGAYLIRFLFKRVIKKAAKSGKVLKEQAYGVTKVVTYVIFVLAIALSLNSLGIQLTALLVGSAALLVGIGFGLQQLFLDIISGFILLFDANINVGNVVQTESFIGKIQGIGLRTTQILTTDNVVIIFPNSKMTMSSVTNLSHSKISSRFRVKVGVAYGSDVEKVKEILISCSMDHPKAENDPMPTVLFRDFGNSSLDFELRFWSKDIFQIETVQSELRFMINERFIKEGITIPFPQRDLHIKSGDISK
ncbi:mechanosensitive ion channel [Candidatus Pacebacteria bacterium]|nr:mechanosensitive ion channel [Candidatus Paceibacterota bacterium]